MSTTTSNLGLFKYDTSTDGNVAFSIDQALNNNWDIIDTNWNQGSNRNIGEIVASTIPLTDAGLHLLDGSLLQGSGSYAEFVTYIAGLRSSYSSLFTTEANWQAAVTANGVCGKFVYDSVNNTVRLPKYSNKIYTSSINSTATVVGNGKALGLTDGTSNYGLSEANGNAYAMKAVNAYGTAIGTTATNTGTSNGALSLGVTSDGTKSGLIAQLSNITTALDGYYYIVVATSTKTSIEVDIDEIATDLNGKADIDLSNVPSTKGILEESYINGTSWYRVYSDGWCEQGGLKAGGTDSVTFLKPFKDANYTVTTQLYSSGSANVTWAQISVASCSETGITWGLTSKRWWMACGYIR